MPVNLSIKNVPQELAERLRRRASRSRRSLQGELLVILEEAVGLRRRLTPLEALEWVRDLGLETPDQAADLVRRDRDER